MAKPANTGLFNEFLTEGAPAPAVQSSVQQQSVEPLPVAEPEQRGLFDEYLIEPSQEVRPTTTGLFDEFATKEPYHPTGMFDDQLLEKRDDNGFDTGMTDEVLSFLGDLGKTTEGLAVTAFRTLRGDKQNATQNLVNSAAQILSPELRNPSELAGTELHAPRFAEEFQKEGISPETSETLGMLASVATDPLTWIGAPKAPKAAGAIEDAFQQFMKAHADDDPSKMFAIGKLFTPADDVAKSEVARNIMLEQFRRSASDLEALKRSVIEQIGEELPKETAELFHDLAIAATDKKQLISTYYDIEKLNTATAAATKPAGSKALNNVKHLYMDSIQAPRVFDMADGYANYKGIQARHAKVLVASETAANYSSRRSVHNMLEEINGLGVDMVTADMETRLTIASLMRQGETHGAKQLMKAKGMVTAPELTPVEEGVLDVVEKHINQYKDDLAATWTKHTGKEFVDVDHYGVPLWYEGDPALDVKKLVNRNYRYTPDAQGLAHKFIEREGSIRVPRSDFFNMVTQQIHNQEYFRHVQPKVDRTRQFLEHPTWAKSADPEMLGYWGEYLSAVENRGANAIPKAMDQLLKSARLNLNNAVLGYRLSSIMMQPFAVFDAMAYANTHFGSKVAGDILNEVLHTWVNPRYANEVIRGSKGLITRQGGELAIRESMESIQSTKLTQGIRKLIPSLSETKALDYMDKGYRKFMSKGFKLLTEADVRTAAGVERAFQKILQKQGVQNWKEEADFLMNMVSASSEVTMRPLILSRGESYKTWLTFQTFMMNRFGVIYHDIINSGMLHAGTQHELALKALAKDFADPSKIEAGIKTGQYTILSAERSALSATENAARTKTLLKELKKKGLKPLPMEGHYGGATENSFLVPGLSETEGLQLAQRYEQESILSPRGFIFSDGTVSPGDPLKTVFNNDATDFYSSIKVGNREVKFQIPINSDIRLPLDPATLTKPLADPQAWKKRLRAGVGLGILAAGQIAEAQARAGIYKLTTDKEVRTGSYAQQLMTFLPEQIPFFGPIIGAVGKNGSGLPPVAKTFENLVKGMSRMTTADKQSTRIKGALQTIQGSASLTLGIPGTSQLFDLLQRAVPEEHKKVKLRKSARQQMINRLKRG